MGRFWGRGRFSKRSASPPDPLSRRVAGNRLVRSYELVRPCSMGAVSCFGVVVAAADRAAATCLRWATTKLQGKRAEGVAGAIGKPPPRARRTRNTNLWRLCRHPSPPSAEGGGPSAAADGGRYSPPLRQRTPQQRSLSSVSLTADSSLCGGSLLVVLPAKPPLKREVPATGGRRGSFPAPQRSRRLCQPP